MSGGFIFFCREGVDVGVEVGHRKEHMEIAKSQREVGWRGEIEEQQRCLEKERDENSSWESVKVKLN